MLASPDYASFMAMNEIYGPYFDIDPLSMLVPEAYAQSGPPRDLFVFDDQLHMVRGSRFDAAAPLRALAQGPSSTFSKSNPLNGKGQKDENGDVQRCQDRGTCTRLLGDG